MGNHGGNDTVDGQRILHQLVTGWWFEPLWKILVNWDDYSKYMEKKNMFQTTNQLLVIMKHCKFHGNVTG